MKLLLDIGNSRIKPALSTDGKLESLAPLDYRAVGVAAALAELRLPAAPRQVWIANVAGAEVGAAAAAACQALWRMSPRLAASSATAFGIHNGYRDAGKLGVDRWLALLAAAARCGRPVCVFGCGTAATVDAVDAAGMHRGGYIVPGPELMHAVLERATDGIRVAQPVPPAAGFGRSTAECVSHGAALAIAALFDRVLDDLRAEQGVPVPAVLSGGGADRILPLLRHPVTHDPQLVLRGLALLAEAD